MTEDNVIIRPAMNTLIINSCSLIILTKEILKSSEIKELTAALFATLVKGIRKYQKLITVFKVLLKDITKALQLKIIKTSAEIQNLPPA